MFCWPLCYNPAFNLVSGPIARFRQRHSVLRTCVTVVEASSPRYHNAESDGPESSWLGGYGTQACPIFEVSAPLEALYDSAARNACRARKTEEARDLPLSQITPSTFGKMEIPDKEAWTLLSNRLLLRPMVQDDAHELFPLLREPALYRFIGGTPPSSTEELRKTISSLESRSSPDGDELWLNWTIRLSSSGLAIGYVQASATREFADLAWVIGLPYQNLGYATEAGQRVANWVREYLEISELRAAIHPEHVASCKVASHIGLRSSGELTEEGEVMWTTN